MGARFSAADLTLLRALADRYPTAEMASAELASLRAALTLPKGTVHVVSDVHGEYKKLRHIINNASGRLRPVVQQLFGTAMDKESFQSFLAVLYYPREAMELLESELVDRGARTTWLRRTIRLQFQLVRFLAREQRRSHVVALFPIPMRELFEELLDEPALGRPASYIDAMLDATVDRGGEFVVVRAASRLIRNLSADEIVIAGDLGDRGPRLDRVIDYIMEQPRTAVTWGNHDLNWMGACLGNEALIATVLRVSLRYRRLSQLEEGYGLIVAPLEKLAREVYADDPAERFMTKGTGLRDDLSMARMQKAIAIMQFKLEGQLIARHPEWEMDHRNVLAGIDITAGTVTIDGKAYPLRDRHLPTFDPSDPNALSSDERTCMNRLREGFVSSARLWEHMSFLTTNGAMWIRRDQALIFHGCVPVDDDGSPLELEVDGKARKGRELFDVFDSVVRRAFRKGSVAQSADIDWFWYLWTGPRSPLFGKNKMTTFESYFVEDKEAKMEKKNPYFKLIHDADFCRRIAAEFGMDENVLIVNGHVPVRVDKGEEPVKKGGNAVTIDGAFSEAYGDRGYTLILAPERIAIAEHHHFESIREAITSGADIVPKITDIRVYDPPRLLNDTEEGAEMRETAGALEKLISAFDDGLIPRRAGLVG